MEIVSGFLGFAILLVGRQFYGVFVGGTFFLTSAFLIDQVWGSPTGFQAIWVPLLFGLLGWGLTMELRRWIARPAIFLGGAYVFMKLPVALGMHVPEHWGFYVLGGAIFFLFSLVWFGYTLIILAMLTGVTMLLTALVVPRGLEVALFAIMAIFSLGAQMVIMRYGQSVPD